MGDTIRTSLIFQKIVQKVSNSLADQLKKIRDRLLGGGRGDSGWTCKIKQPIDASDTGDGRTSLLATFEFVCKPKKARNAAIMEEEARTIGKLAEAAGRAHNWHLVSKDGEEVKSKESEMGYVHLDVPNKWRSHFDHLYDRDAQIEITLSALREAIESDFENRFHVCLYGAPASGKTEIVRSIKALLGQEAILEYDCTSTTMAGAIKDIAERDVLPRVLILEEAEKADTSETGGGGSLRWLLSVLDHRAEIRKVTARQHVQRDVKFWCVATVNDFEMFRGIMFGALASRFSHHLHCPRPSERVVRKILEREITRRCGDVRWIDPAMDYASRHEIHDPRRVLGICLCGRDQLLTGQYQRKLDSCTE